MTAAETVLEKPPALSAPPAESGSASSEKRPYPPPSETPTQAGSLGIRFDYNDGCRVLLPEGGKWKIRLSDTDTGNILFQTSLGGGQVPASTGSGQMPAYTGHSHWLLSQVQDS